MMFLFCEFTVLPLPRSKESQNGHSLAPDHFNQNGQEGLMAHVTRGGGYDDHCFAYALGTVIWEGRGPCTHARVGISIDRRGLSVIAYKGAFAQTYNPSRDEAIYPII